VTRGTRILVAACLFSGLVSIAAGPATQAPATAAPPVIEQAGRYVEAYVDAFSAVVSEERQVQKLVAPDGRVKTVRELTSDFLLVKTGGAWPAVFRDVISVDGKSVRNREDRLRKLFLDDPKTAVELAKAIAKESQRYNIGLQRTGNSPLLPLIFLTPRVASGVRFETAGARITFQEFRSPSVLARTTGQGRQDLMSRGSFEIDAQTGRVLAAEFVADGPPGVRSARFAVRYDTDPKLDLSVPVEVTETYWRAEKPHDDRLEVHSTYSDFRRFQVVTGEQIKK
jgi:hypothetical protein